MRKIYRHSFESVFVQLKIRRRIEVRRRWREKKIISSGANSIIIIIIHPIFLAIYFIFSIDLENRFYRRSINEHNKIVDLRTSEVLRVVFFAWRDRLEKCIISSRCCQSHKSVRLTKQLELILESRLWRDIRRAHSVFLLFSFLFWMFWMPKFWLDIGIELRKKNDTKNALNKSRCAQHAKKGTNSRHKTLKCQPNFWKRFRWDCFTYSIRWDKCSVDCIRSKAITKPFASVCSEKKFRRNSVSFSPVLVRR